MARKKKINIKSHVLIPKHIRLSEKEKKELFEKYHITLRELPKISENDPALQNIKVKSGDVVKIIRKSKTAGEGIFYRGIVNE